MLVDRGWSYKHHDAHRFGVLYVQADPVSRLR